MNEQPNAEKLVYSEIQRVIGDSKYGQGKVKDWTEVINTNIVQELQKLSPNFKYLVSTLIIQKCGAGMHLESTCSWDPKTDSSVTIQYDNNNTLHCITTVFALLL